MKRTQLGYISWPKAFAILQRVSPTTIEEVAMWIWDYPRDPRKEKNESGGKREVGDARGIRAYTEVVCESHESWEDNAPYRFSFDALQLSEPDDAYMHLVGLWFSEREIRAFKPIDRYLTHGQVATQWSKYEIPHLASFLRAQVQAGNLLDMHPVFGETQLTNPEATHRPAAVKAIFLKKQIDLIESKDLKGTARNLRGKLSKRAQCVDQAEDIRLTNPKMSKRAIAHKIFKLDNQKDDSDETKLGLREESIRKYINKMGNT